MEETKKLPGHWRKLIYCWLYIYTVMASRRLAYRHIFHPRAGGGNRHVREFITGRRAGA
jgi:hypothetical protein